MKFSHLCLLLIFFQSCVAQPAEKLKTNSDNNTLLWEISGNNLSKPSYLFGTFHMMCRDDIHLSQQLNLALKNASEVYFEMDLDDPSNTLGAMLFMNMKNGKSLKDLYSPADYKKIEQFFKDSVGMPLSNFQRMKPSMLGAFLYPKMMPCKTMSGVDMELLRIATENKKEIKGFETIAMQAAVFDSIPYESQAAELLKTIDSFQFYRKSFDSLVYVYKTQQLGAMDSLFNQSEFGLDDNRDIMLDGRNKNWVLQLKTIMPEKNIFMAVGAGHLVGENGLISLLKKEGYTLRPLANR